MKAMKYPNFQIESMTSIMLGDSSNDGLNGDTDKKDPKEGNAVGNFLNSLLNGADDIVDVGSNLVKKITNSGISGKGTQPVFWALVIFSYLILFFF